MKTATISPTGKTVNVIAARQKNSRRRSRRDRNSDLEGSSGDSFAALSLLSDQRKDRTDSDLDDKEHRQRKRRGELQIVRPLSELFARLVDYQKYKLVNNGDDNQDLFRCVPQFWKKIDVPMRPQVFSDSDLILGLSFLAKYSNACKPNRVLESTVVCCLQLYVDG